MFNFLMLLIFATSVWAQNTINVSPGNNKIQTAISTAQDGDIIVLAPGYYIEDIKPVGATGLTAGVYFGSGYGIAKNLTLKSSGGANATIVDVNGAQNAVAIMGNSGNVKIEGITFNGYNEVGIRNPLPSFGGNTITILNNRIINASGASLTVGAGIAISSDNSLIKGNTVEGARLNDDVYGGAGIMIQNASNCIIENNVVYGSDYGIGIGAWKSGNNRASNNNIVRYNTVRNNLVGGLTSQYNVSNTLYFSNDVYDNYEGYVELHDSKPNGEGVISNTTLDKNNFYGNEINGSVNARIGSPDVPAEYKVLTSCNYWGAATGPFNATLNPSGLGAELISDNWILDGWSSQKWTANSGNCTGAEFWVTNNTGQSATLNWNPSAFPQYAAANYFVVHIRPKGSNQIWRQGPTDVPSRNIPNLLQDTEYEVRVLFFKEKPVNPPVVGNYLGFIGLYYFTTEGDNISIEQNIGTTFLVKWKPIEGAATYMAQIKDGAVWKNSSITANTSARFFSLTPGNEYPIRIVAFDGGLNTIGSTPEKEFTTEPNMNFQFNNNTNTMSWKNVNGITRYIFRYRVAGSEGAWLNANTNTNSRTLQNLIQGTEYEYRLLAYYGPNVTDYAGATLLQKFTPGGKKSVVVNENLPFVNVYPNPFVDVLNIELESDIEKTITYSIVDVTGKLVQTGTQNIIVGYNTITVNVSELPQGIYVINAGNQSFIITK
jgi:parallel beta-helix repeat protein